MADQHLFGGQVGQHVDEAEQLNLEVLMAHAPVHDLTDPPVLVEDRGALTANEFEECPAALGNVGFKLGPVQNRGRTALFRMTRRSIVERLDGGLLLILMRFLGHGYLQIVGHGCV